MRRLGRILVKTFLLYCRIEFPIVLIIFLFGLFASSQVKLLTISQKFFAPIGVNSVQGVIRHPMTREILQIVLAVFSAVLVINGPAIFYDRAAPSLRLSAGKTRSQAAYFLSKVCLIISNAAVLILTLPYFFFPFASARSKFSFTLNLTILLIRSKGIGLSNGNFNVPFPLP